MLAKPSVLVTDDEAGILKLLRVILSDHYEVFTASNTEEAMVSLVENEPTILLSDVRMPGADGMQLLVESRKVIADLPVILLTAHGDKELVIEAIKNGAFDFLEKPIEEDQLLFSLQRAANFAALKKRNRSVYRLLKRRNLEFQNLREQFEELSGNSQQSAIAVAHEVRSPLTVIVGYTQYIRKQLTTSGTLEEPVDSALARIEKAAWRTSDIISATLAIFDKRNEPILLANENLVEIVEDSLVLLEDSVERDSVNLSVQSAQPNIQVECQPVQLSQVVVNVVKNALDAIRLLDEKWITIQIDISSAFAVVGIKNSGPKIAGEIERRIFDNKFTTKAEEGGFGIGLHFCKRLIEEVHKGRLLYDNSLEHTNFKIILPLKGLQNA